MIGEETAMAKRLAVLALTPTMLLVAAAPPLAQEEATRAGAAEGPRHWRATGSPEQG
jgi:hypothetical protein